MLWGALSGPSVWFGACQGETGAEETELHRHHSSVVEGVRERTEPGSAPGRVKHGAGGALGKSCMDTWKHVDLGVRTEYWDRDLERLQGIHGYSSCG